METARRGIEPTTPQRGDQRVRLHGVSWAAYEALLKLRGKSSAVRISYRAGEVELMAPSDERETDKTRLARLIEAWSEEAGIDLDGVGSRPFAGASRPASR